MSPDPPQCLAGVTPRTCPYVDKGVGLLTSSGCAKQCPLIVSLVVGPFSADSVRLVQSFREGTETLRGRAELLVLFLEFLNGLPAFLQSVFSLIIHVSPSVGAVLWQQPVISSRDANVVSCQPLWL